ncbi:3-phosphoshikimate 1-carboxyvinyltransferase [Brochothrix thermosphacta]|uniref:3-phosphoshikimate 1-carboxyvinyltransferase n=1 Tax=Brochothrix thermosphacta TaxID=2756 RepID=A0A1D2LDS6_BROTH|nr:3-phosphoshikimate 1-carboxyvinyltransferase [Brochothrix thermosphacta]ATF26668.1 3-phosphoshikimate 1-carboxyvinyltransferase [Brochothrix thermosphacta]ATH86023.1 3-phosphoshikimate 1-carboxyvinyltransferase [Brochothrix thermosphacta]MPQ29203.1 3-phosphoshikimate 1-carboxyvinyltransferase [Brochothrix thermosphacta]ODJ68135.1 3-phosphoshikimate 1-carboxyvinyltransferase [Brochothrix thermosphacta]ODJ70856.1 3-phosphoshikimate 1-carboxyvinyltransferase [Brochothrix thermosphacta]
MKTVNAIKQLNGTIEVPGDKSISHRAIMFGALANGQTTIEHFSHGEDCLSTIAVFRQLGVAIDVSSDKITVHGTGIESLKQPSTILDVGNSGTTIRLMMGILAGRPFESRLTGDASIQKRPMNRVITPLKTMSAAISAQEGGLAPVTVSAVEAITGINYDMPVASAQVKSALLFAGMQSDDVTIINEKEKSRDHTERMLQQFGGEITIDGLSISITKQPPLQGQNIYVPGDISSAAFFLVAASLLAGSKVTLKNVGMNPTRTGIIDVLRDMGAAIAETSQPTTGEPLSDLTVSAAPLKATEIGGSLIPRLIDELPIIALLATQAEGTTVIKDAEELKVKETNRIDTVAEELTKMGADITATPDGLIIKGPTALHGATVSSHGDHRIGMMLAVAGFIASSPVELEDAEAIAVSYPNFFEHVEQLSK